MNPQFDAPTKRQILPWKIVLRIMGGLFVAVVITTGYLFYQELHKQQVEVAGLQRVRQIEDQYAPLSFDRTDGMSYFAPNQFLHVQVDGMLHNYVYKLSQDMNGDAIIDLTDEQVFDNPQKLLMHASCVNMAEIRTHPRPTKTNEVGPITEHTNALDKMYAYWPKLGVCSTLYSDTELLAVQGIVNSLKSQY